MVVIIITTRDSRSGNDTRHIGGKVQENEKKRGSTWYVQAYVLGGTILPHYQEKLYYREKICLEKRFIHVENVVIVEIVRYSDINLPVKVDVLKCTKK